MKIILQNDIVRIENPPKEILNLIKSDLVYKDKSKEYQLRKMLRNPWSRNSPACKQLQQEICGSLFKEDGDAIIFSSALFDQYRDVLSGASLIDSRKETGQKLALPWVNKPFDLRDYQQEAVDEMLKSNRGIINYATGLGKTLLATHLIKQYKRKTLVVCPSESVAKQFYEILESSFGKIRVGFYGGGKKKISDITVGIAASVSINIEEFKKENLGLVIIDECHHTPANTFMNIAEGLAGVGKLFGLTATDYRSDGKDLLIKAGCGSVLVNRDIRWGIDEKWLAEPYFIIREVPTTGKDYKDDKLKSYKEHVLNNQIMKSRIESDARSMMDAGKQILVLVDEVAHGKELAANLGVPFATGQDKKSQEYVDALNKGKIKGLIGTDGKIGEGSDTKNVDVLIMANFVASKGPVIQCVGRALRKQKNKTKALILDYIPMGSTILKRHAMQRMNFYREITDKVKHVQLMDAKEEPQNEVCVKNTIDNTGAQ